MKKQLTALISLLGLALTASAGEGPGGVGEVSSNGARDLRLWLNSDGESGSRTHANNTIPNHISPHDDGVALPFWPDLSGSGKSFILNEDSNPLKEQVFADYGVRRDTHLLSVEFDGPRRLSPKTDDAHLYMKLDEIGSNTAADRFDPARNGTFMGNPKHGVRFYGSTATQFDGVDDYVQLPSGALGGLAESFYISAWIMPDDVSPLANGSRRQRIISSTDGLGWGLGLNNDNIIFTFYNQSDYTFVPINGNPGIQPGVWTHIELLVPTRNPQNDGGFSPDKLRAFINGEQVNTLDWTDQLNPTSAPYIIGGKTPTSELFTGAIADVMVVDQFDYRDHPRAHIRHLATDQVLNNQAWVRMYSEDAQRFKSPANFSAGIGTDISIFAVTRNTGEDLSRIGNLQTLLIDSSSERKLFIKYPDKNNQIAFHFGPQLNSGDFDTSTAVLRTPFAGSNLSDQRDFRSLSFFSSQSGQQIVENGHLLAQKAGTVGAAIGPLQIGSENLFNLNDSHTDLAELVIYNRVLSAPEKAVVENYLAAKYQLGQPAIDLYDGENRSNGDFDNGVMGIANIGSDQNDSAAGGGLVLTDQSFLTTSGQNSLMVGYKDGGIPARLLPSSTQVAHERWWYFDIRTEGGTGAGLVDINFDYRETVPDAIIPPNSTHYLLYTKNLDVPFQVIRIAERSGDVVNFGLFEMDDFLSGYYAIATAHPDTPIPVQTFVVAGGNQAAAHTSILAHLATINSLPNAGNVYELDLSALKNPGNGPGVPPFTVGNGFDTYEIKRNLIITGPESLFPNRLVLNSRIEIDQAFVAISDLTLRDNDTARRGGAISAHNADLSLTRVNFINNAARGSNGSFIPVSFGIHGLFGEPGGQAKEEFVSNLPAGDGGFGAGGGGGLNGGHNNGSSVSGIGGFGGSDGIYTETTSTNSVAGGAHAGLGGAIFMYSGALRLDTCGFSGNVAEGGSGGIRSRLSADGTSHGTPVPMASGLGGAIFLWEEAHLTGLRSPLFLNNSSISEPQNWNFPGEDPVPDHGVNNQTFWGAGLPDDSKFPDLNALAAAQPFIDPFDGSTNHNSGDAFLFRLYGEENGVIVPRYELLEEDESPTLPAKFATDAALLAHRERLDVIDREYAKLPSSFFFQKLALDARFNLATLHGLRGDGLFQACVESPFLTEFGTTGFSTNLTTDIVELEEASGHYADAIGIYMDFVRTKNGNDAFEALVPNLPYQQYYYKKDGVEEYLPVPSPAGSIWADTRYRDLALLYELLNDYARTAQILGDTTHRRRGPGDEDNARAIAADAITRLEGWSSELESRFEDVVFTEERSPGLESSIIRLQQTITELNTFQSYVNGKTNPLGFADDFLLLIPPSVDPGAANNYLNSFHSFDRFVEELYPAGQPAGLLQTAVTRQAEAKTSLENFKGSRAEINDQIAALIASYKARINTITGIPVSQLTTTDFELPTQHVVNSQLWEQFNNILRAKDVIKLNRIKINNLNQEIRIELNRNAQEKGINYDRDQLTISYGNKVARIDEKIAAIEIGQGMLSEFTSLIDVNKLANPLYIFEASAKAISAAGQAGAELGKLELEKDKDALAKQQMLDETALDNDLLDIESKAFVATRLLKMDELDHESKTAAKTLRQELSRMSGLADEIKQNRADWKTAEFSIANRYHADPAVRGTIVERFRAASGAFKEAQTWIFFATRALEYKWNKPFSRPASSTVDGNVWTIDTLFKVNNAKGLEEFMNQLEQFDSNNFGGAANSNPTDWISVRDFVFNVDSDTDFQTRLTESVDPNGGDIVLDFSTLRENGLNFFSGPVFNPNGTIQNGKKGTYLDKINTMHVVITYNDQASASGGNYIGNLAYGGTSYIRNAVVGTPDPSRPDKLLNEYSTFTTRGAFLSPDQTRWIERDIPQTHQITIAKAFDDGNEGTLEAAVAATTFRIVAMQERSVATTDWKLVIVPGAQPFDMGKITDIKIRFDHFTSSRQ